jgi:uncharacterized protein
MIMGSAVCPLIQLTLKPLPLRHRTNPKTRRRSSKSEPVLGYSRAIGQAETRTCSSAIIESFLSLSQRITDKGMKTLDQSLLETVTRRLVAEFEPEQVWLYGSHAWGNPNENSDIDLLVVVSHSDESPIRRSQRAHRCLRKLRMPKDVLVETRQEVDRVKERRTSGENLRGGPAAILRCGCLSLSASSGKAVKAV